MRRWWPACLLSIAAAAAPVALAQPADRLAQIAARGELRVCIWPDSFAMSCRHPRSGVPEGIEVDPAGALAARPSVQLRFVETRFAAFMDRIEAGDCDIAMMAVGITPAREAPVAFSEPYLASALSAVTTRTHPTIRGWEDIGRPGHEVAVAAGPLWRDALWLGHAAWRAALARRGERLPRAEPRRWRAGRDASMRDPQRRRRSAPRRAGGWRAGRLRDHRARARDVPARAAPRRGGIR
jgi:hypothetical protein